MSATQKRVALLVLLAFAVVGATAWYVRSGKIEALYLDAAADCAAGKGAGRLRSVDAMYDEASRPRALALALSTCDLSQAVDDYDAAMDRLNALD